MDGLIVLIAAIIFVYCGIYLFNEYQIRLYPNFLCWKQSLPNGSFDYICSYDNENVTTYLNNVGG